MSPLRSQMIGRSPRNYRVQYVQGSPEHAAPAPVRLQTITCQLCQACEDAEKHASLDHSII